MAGIVDPVFSDGDQADEGLLRARSLSPRRYAPQLLQRSEEYLAAFEALKIRENKSLLYPGYFLLVHATELALKAWLSAHDLSLKAQLKLRHGIAEAAALATEQGLPEVDDLDHLVACAEALSGEAHDLRYPNTFLISAPEPDQCATVVRDLITAMRPEITKRGTSAALRELGTAANAAREKSGR